MIVKQYLLPLVNEAGERSQCVFILSEFKAQHQCHLTLRYSRGEIAAEAPDYFEAMCQIREELESQGLRPICFGSSQYVYPSAMCRGAGGLKAYKQELGRRAMRSDMVMIFDTAPDVQPATVQDQRKFHEQWLQSLGFTSKRRQGLGGE
jgi:hypothetical protein